MNEPNHSDHENFKYYGSCVLCQKTSDHVCNRCGDFYCSPECQRKDWRRHRYICFAIPKLVSNNEFYDLTLKEAYLNSGYGCNSNIDNRNISAFQIIPSISLGPSAQFKPTLRMELQKHQQLQQLQPHHSSTVSKQQQPLQNKIQQPNQELKETKSHLQETQQQQREPQSESSTKNEDKQSDKQQMIRNNAQQNQQPQEQNDQDKQQNHQQQDQQQNQQSKQQTQQSTVQIAYLEPVISPEAYPTNNSCVVITGFRKINHLTVRYVSDKNNLGAADVAEKMQAAGKMAKKWSYPKIYQFALIKSLGCWHRIKILYYHSKSSVRILFVDLGYTALRKLDEIYKIDHDMITLPKYTVQVKLNEVTNCVMTRDLIEWLKEAVNVEYKIVFKYHNNDDDYDTRSPIVDLYNWETNEWLNEKIRQHCSALSECSDSTMTLHDDVINEDQQEQSCASQKQEKTIINDINSSTRALASSSESKIESSSQSTASKNHTYSILDPVLQKSNVENIITASNDKEQSSILNPPFNFKKLSVGATNVIVFIVEDALLANGKMACMDLRDSGILAETQLFLRNYTDPVPYTPVKGEYVIVKFQNEWLRSKVLEINSNGGDNKAYNMFLVDFKIEITVDVDLIRRYPIDLNVECVTSLCHIANLPPILSDEHINFLKTKLQASSVITIDKILSEGPDDCCDCFLTIELKEVIQQFNELFTES